MELKASAMSKIAAFRMVPYTCRRIRSQLCSLVVALAFVALPMAGVEAAPAPILTPLATQLVPLGTGLESPPAVPFEVPAFAAPAKTVLGLLTPAALEPEREIGGRPISFTLARPADSDLADAPHGRSPPAQ
ncbi:MAG TPA: hypothetical protein VJX23_01290 [Candidatus Binataceae bacterium]|nr:hypothetical protein [Candidatus Binataceae bacterium]